MRCAAEDWTAAALLLKRSSLRRWIHYARRHWEQLKGVPGISWQRIARSHTMMSIDQELTCKVLLHSFTFWHEIVGYLERPLKLDMPVKS